MNHPQCLPVFHDGRLVAFAATTALHLAIGALSPGSCGIVDAIDAYAEALQFHANNVCDRCRRNDVCKAAYSGDCFRLGELLYRAKNTFRRGGGDRTAKATTARRRGDSGADGPRRAAGCRRPCVVNPSRTVHHIACPGRRENFDHWRRRRIKFL
jgi:hypothetical protein